MHSIIFSTKENTPVMNVPAPARMSASELSQRLQTLKAVSGIALTSATYVSDEGVRVMKVRLPNPQES